VVVFASGSGLGRSRRTKLGALEATCSLPVRYCEASLLRSLRQHLPGPVDYARFLKICVAADRILSVQEIRQIIESDRAIRGAHNDFVQTLLTRNSI
jgi:hypothetical protein